MAAASCAKCGASIDAGAQFCMKCGADISGQQSAVATAYVPPTGTQQVHDQLLHTLRQATLGDYEVLTELGRGGMATVYLAHDIHLDRKVAIKVMNPGMVSGEGMVERFKLEARTAAGLSHPHIIPIYAVKETNHLLFFVMKFVEGRPLDSIIKEAAPLPVAMVRTVIMKVGEALGYAHRRGVIHRDIKPANIMIDTEGMPIVTDFGIAKVADKQGLTMTGATIGTPTYMSPEQCNALEITGASDQYSLGVLAYEMLTGNPLFDGDSVMTIMYKHCHEEPPPVESFGPEVPADVASAIMKMLEKEPADRFESIETALPHLGSGALAYDDSVRSQLIAYAKQGENRDILKRVSTPSSPIPASRVPGIDTDATVRFSAGAGAAAAGAAPTAVVTPRKSRKGLWLGLAALAVVAAGVGVAMFGPLGSRATPGSTDAATPPTTATTEPATPPPAVPGEGGAPAATPADPAAQQPRPQVARSTRPAGPAPVRSVRIIDPPTQVQVGGSVPLRATVLDENGDRVSRAPEWRSLDTRIVQITADGRLQAIAPGSARITATLDGRSDEVEVRVAEAAVGRVSVTPAVSTLEQGGSQRLTAVVSAADGSPLQPRTTVTWTSNNPAAAVVTSGGMVRAVGPGDATITATIDGVSGIAQVTVTAPAAAAVDNRALVEQTIQAYARALEAGDISAVRRVYPGLPSEETLRNSLGLMEDLKVALTVGTVDLSGDVARATVTGTWNFYNTASRRDMEIPADNLYVLARRNDRWVITEIR